MYYVLYDYAKSKAVRIDTSKESVLKYKYDYIKYNRGKVRIFELDEDDMLERKELNIYLKELNGLICE